mmetsp:Transcript_7942/g.29710  ORF Transcript_7942/g.29710 Transcript_7942/m.29710 type:complete len:429 (-) Transcript_7942:51-1337(-)
MRKRRKARDQTADDLGVASLSPVHPDLHESAHRQGHAVGGWILHDPFSIIHGPSSMINYQLKACCTDDCNIRSRTLTPSCRCHPAARPTSISFPNFSLLWLHLLLLRHPKLANFLGRLQRAPELVAIDEDLPEVVVVVRVVDRVVLGAHDRLDVSRHGVVDVCGPDAREEEHQQVRDVVARHQKHRNDVRRGLRDPVQRVERNAGPGRKRRRRVVLVMQRVHVLVQELVGVKGPVHPVDADLHQHEVGHRPREVVGPSADLVHVEIGPRVAVLDQPGGEDREGRVAEHGGLREADLVPDGGSRRDLVLLALENPLTEDMVDHDVPNARCDVVHQNSRNQVAQVGHHVVAKLLSEALLKAPARRLAEEDAVDQVVEGAVGILLPEDIHHPRVALDLDGHGSRQRQDAQAEEHRRYSTHALLLLTTSPTA